jgi:ribonuclease T2
VNATLKIVAAAIPVLCLTLAGCGPNPANPSASPAIAAGSPARSAGPAALPAPTAEGSPYDFYLLNLSWSPEFCFTHADSPECAAHPGFVVHGLWPQRTGGGYPENCGDRPGPTSDAVWAGLMPTASLAAHEWKTQGTCTPYAADAYFSLVRRAAESVKIPPQFTATTRQTMEPPAAVIDAFAQVNPGFPAGSIALSCGHNYLTAIEVCFDKDLNPIACTGIRTCRANVVKITPQTGNG